jgi:hypothetical protein
MGVKPTVSTIAPGGSVSEKARLLARALALPPAQMMRVTFELEDAPEDWAAFRTGDDVARAAFIAQRQMRLAPIRASLLSWLNGIGAKNVESLWLANLVHADIPAIRVQAAAQRSDVVNLTSGGDVVPEQLRAWGGKEYQDGLRIRQFYNAGIKGHRGSRRAGGRIKIAILDVNMPYRDHPAFKTASGTSRLRRIRDCRVIGCPETNAAPSPEPDGSYKPHGNIVSWVAGGSIEDGQDTSLPGTDTDDQRIRSGNLRDAYVHYYRVGDPSTISGAVQKAVEENADLINMSFHVPSDPAVPQSGRCDRLRDANGLNVAMLTALNTGVVMTAAAGNLGESLDETNCTIGYPALRSETIAVGGLNTGSSMTAYDDTGIWYGSSAGGMMIRTVAGGFPTVSSVDLVAPARVDRWPIVHPTFGTNTYAQNMADGTSFAAPGVASMIGAMKNAFWSVGWGANDARMLMVNALLMGNGWRPGAGGGTGTISQSGMGYRSGAGKPKTHWPSSADLQSPWGWGWRAVSIRQGETVSWPVGDSGMELSSVMQWKWAVLYTSPSMNDVPDIDFYIDNTCGPGTYNMYSDTGYDLRARFRLSWADIAGRCLQMRAYGYSVSGTVTFYSADYFHGGEETLH